MASLSSSFQFKMIWWSLNRVVQRPLHCGVRSDVVELSALFFQAFTMHIILRYDSLVIFKQRSRKGHYIVVFAYVCPNT